ncbi:uncharacterized protein L969DRAFT_78391 [Mixia osmundae IAM 14324]|uniref:Uncharacterized protein n=1 Tax=Mixia osmundae (strain CBS 9802 / IAM 14324 / JCM 22182 / KY 12970) TaxID=764103 RepID=G7DWH6_MIXOS|nr:uncharacterized protein L969DRAFT_78391 [Mixia osmundae IAM 14324]KEI37338.1 hypothetical protein L969DRAFT_78391 [Mixia osmundae IAM 14324]GAA94936.1 hypothetical protein E5Q_01591 [Mixia osmundae IAM 14324]
MSTIFDQQNYSLLAPIAVWGVGIGTHIYGLMSQNLSGTGEFDNVAPRAYLQKMQSIPKPSALQRRVIRAESAQSNTFENLGFFAAAIIAGNVAKLPSSTLNKLASAYVLTRVLYSFAYVTIESGPLSYIRTVLFFSGAGICITLFVKASEVFKNAIYLHVTQWANMSYYIGKAVKRTSIKPLSAQSINAITEQLSDKQTGESRPCCPLTAGPPEEICLASETAEPEPVAVNSGTASDQPGVPTPEAGNETITPQCEEPNDDKLHGHALDGQPSQVDLDDSMTLTDDAIAVWGSSVVKGHEEPHEEGEEIPNNSRASDYAYTPVDLPAIPLPMRPAKTPLRAPTYPSTLARSDSLRSGYPISLTRPLEDDWPRCRHESDRAPNSRYHPYASYARETHRDAHRNHQVIYGPPSYRSRSSSRDPHEVYMRTPVSPTVPRGSASPERHYSPQITQTAGVTDSNVHLPTTVEQQLYLRQHNGCLRCHACPATHPTRSCRVPLPPYDPIHLPDGPQQHANLGHLPTPERSPEASLSVPKPERSHTERTETLCDRRQITPPEANDLRLEIHRETLQELAVALRSTDVQTMTEEDGRDLVGILKTVLAMHKDRLNECRASPTSASREVETTLRRADMTVRALDASSISRVEAKAVIGILNGLRLGS